MLAKRSGWPFSAILFAIVAAGLSAPGCTMTPRQYWESLRGEGFTGWSDKAGAGVRGDTSAAKPSGFFTDRRSDQIEQDLGGGF